MTARIFGYGKGKRRHIASGSGTISAVTALCGQFIPFGNCAVAKELPICKACIYVERSIEEKQRTALERPCQ